MGKDLARLKYHLFYSSNLIELVITETKSKEFVWLSLYVEPDLRKFGLAEQITKFALYTLKGTHHIHWFSYLKLFRKLSIELKWASIRKSNVFEACDYAVAKNINNPTHFYPALKRIVVHKITNKCPKLKNYKNKHEQRKVLQKIQEIHRINSESLKKGI